MTFSKLHKKMVIGLLSGTLLHASPSENKEPSESKSRFLQMIAETRGNIASHDLTEDEILLELNQEGATLFRSLSPEGKALALKLASRGCNNQNDCKGENACRTDKNECAGQGACKGQTKCAFSEKNQAVKVASQLMAEKRKSLLTPQNNQ